jgi:hypothetical protein
MLQVSLLLLSLGLWACGQRSCVGHYVDGLRGGAVAPDRRQGAMAELRQQTWLVRSDLPVGLSILAHVPGWSLQKADVFTVMFR